MATSLRTREKSHSSVLKRRNLACWLPQTLLLEALISLVWTLSFK